MGGHTVTIIIITIVIITTIIITIITTIAIITIIIITMFATRSDLKRNEAKRTLIHTNTHTYIHTYIHTCNCINKYISIPRPGWLKKGTPSSRGEGQEQPTYTILGRRSIMNSNINKQINVLLLHTCSRLLLLLFYLLFFAVAVNIFMCIDIRDAMVIFIAKYVGTARRITTNLTMR